jgi:hypothetical protein
LIEWWWRRRRIKMASKQTSLSGPCLAWPKW